MHIFFNVSVLAANWDKWGVKDFFNNNVSNAVKDGTRWIGNQFKSVGKFFSNLFKKSSRYEVSNVTSLNYAAVNTTNTISNSFTAGSTAASGGFKSNYRGNGADIHMPTQHSILGINMTALSEGNIIQQFAYGVANSFNIPIQYMMGRGIGDGSMRNLNGTPTTIDEGVMSFGTLPLWFTGGRAAGETLMNGGKTFAEYRTAYWAGRAKPVLDPLQNEVTGQVWKQYMELHHRFIPQRWKWAPNWLKNNRFNLQELNSLEHAMRDPYRARFAPKWAKEQYNLIWK